MKKILVPCDFSEPAREAFKSALNIASITKGEVYVLHVVDLPLRYDTTFGAKPFVFDESIKKEIFSLAKLNFENLLDFVESSNKEVKIHFKLELGSVTNTIYKFICNNEMDLVVMATHGAGGWTEFFIGSTTEKIIRISPTPVLTVKKALKIDSVKNIVFPTNLSLKHNDAIGRIKEIQRLFKARLHILFVNTPGNFQRDKEINEDLKQFSQKNNFDNFTLNIRNDIYEEYGIIHFAQEIKSDLIVMNTHGRRGVAHLVIGSITEDVLDNVQCAVISFSSSAL